VISEESPLLCAKELSLEVAGIITFDVIIPWLMHDPSESLSRQTSTVL
jgi:hypothetical protein